MIVKVLKGSGSCDREISERKTATSVVGKDGQRSWLRELRESARALGLRLRRRGSLYLLTFTGDDPVLEAEELHEVAEFLQRARTGWLPPLPRDLVERLARQGFVAEPAPPPLGNLRYRLRHVKTGQVLGIRGYIWSRQEIERMVEIWEDYERRMRESEADGCEPDDAV
jgi:hypothetical protein